MIRISSTITVLLLLSNFAVAQIVGPCIGSVGTTDAFFLYRPGDSEKRLRLSVLSMSGEVVTTTEASATAADDFVAKFHVEGLESAAGYRYQIAELVGTGEPKILAGGDDLKFETFDATRKSKVTAALISCVSKDDTAPVWEEIGKLSPDLLYLAGDTPYIDTTELKAVRQKHRALLNEAPLAKIIGHTPVVGMWDDHDFGLNNGNGKNLEKGKSVTRKGFAEYRAHRNYGNGSEGVYHKTDLGAMEIFHLDPRWFSQSEPSPVDPSQPSCFGKGQWRWLLRSLKESKAPFKVLSMGAIWQDKKNTETDDMFTYWYERDALFDFIERERIDGVILHGGDIHVARYLVHPDRVGYDLHDFIMSPGHNRIIPSLDVYHPSLEWSLVEGQQFLTLEADPTLDDPTLTATYRQPGGKVNKRVVIKHSELVQPERISPLRASWSFDKDLSNSSALGERLDATAHNGASIVGGALRLDRSQQQFVNVPRSFLDDNSAGHSISCWINPTSLPAHGSKDRHFIFESTAEGKPDPQAAYHLSLELSPAGNPEEIVVRLHTITLKPGGSQKAPTPLAQGSFQTRHPRAQVENQWSHLLVTFDSEELKVYFNGKLAGSHQLKVPGPASEFGGLIIGGHRAGTGRNFDGLIDAVTAWQAVVDAEQVAKLYNGGRSARH
ncbi:MAG: alkaline phosphatase D [Pseudoalteromonas tetraodonis]|jgi:alkaline phosphatase D